MTKLAVTIVLALAIAAGACKRRERIQLEATEETAALTSTVHTADPAAAPQLVRGFHEIEQNSWRWTMSSFSVALKPPPGSQNSGAQLVANISVPETVISRVRETRLTASIGGSQIGFASYAAPGGYRFVADVPPAALGDEAVRVDFALDRFLAAGSVDSRELGLIVSSISLEAK